MNSSTQKYRLQFFVDDQMVEVETAGDQLIKAIGEVPDCAKTVIVNDLNVASPIDTYWFYYDPGSRHFASMQDAVLFPQSKAQADWWNAHIGGKLTWAEETNEPTA